MKMLKDLIERCHKRHGKAYQQRKTVVTPALHKSIPFNIEVYCARSQRVMLDDLEQANISFMPIGRAPDNDRGPRDFAGTRFLERQRTDSWEFRRWYESWGIQVYTGMPSEQHGAIWHDIHFTYQAICADPDAVLTCIETLVNSVANPLVTLLKSGGLRFTCRVPNLLHPNTEDTNPYIYKHTPTPENPSLRVAYLEILGENGFSRWDSRYEILFGNLLEPPIIPKEVLFTPIDALRDILHAQTSDKTDFQISTSQESVLHTTNSFLPPPFNSHNLNLASETMLKRGFTYLRQDNDVYHWSLPDSIGGATMRLSVWEDQETVWIRANTADTGLPTKKTPITDIWNDSDTTHRTFTMELPIDQNVHTIREGKLSPLAVKRPPTVLRKQPLQAYTRQQDNVEQIHQVFENDIRILNVTPDTVQKINDWIESILLSGSETNLNIPTQTLADAKAQVSTTPKLFFNPYYADLLEQTIQPIDQTEQIYILDEKYADIDRLFVKCVLRINVISEWSVNWEGSVLGNFAKALLNAIEPHGKSTANPITRLRYTIQAFQSQEEKIIWQMCRVNARGKVIARGVSDPYTGAELARLCIAFEGGASAYIPLDKNTAEILKANGLHFVKHHSSVVGEVVSIPMKMSQAIQLGILDVKTTEKIQESPTVCKNSNWTYWHQLKRFFDYYQRDADAPMEVDKQKVVFWLPPILHPKVKRLLLITPMLSEQHLHKLFPDIENNNIKLIQSKSSPWLPNNKVFQIRSDNCQRHTILNYESNWDTIGLSEFGKRLFTGIRDEIERNTNVTHAIITYKAILGYLEDFTQKENLHFVTHFKDTFWSDTSIEPPHVLWVVGSPFWSQRLFWRRAQILFGSEENPLQYDNKIEPHDNTDERIQSVYQQYIVAILTQIIGWTGLHVNTDRKVVLLTSTPLPNITDKPQTMFFDWEDFEIAGELNKLPEVIATRERFEADYQKLTAESNRIEVERVLGCSARKANRFLKKLRGGNIQRVSLREQILSLLENGEKKAGDFVEATGSGPQTIGKELKRLMDLGEIVRIRRGIYRLPET